MQTELILQIPHHLAPGCTLILDTLQTHGSGRRAKWMCRDSVSSFEALTWLCRVAGNPDYSIQIRMSQRYELGLHGTPLQHAIGLWVYRICRSVGGPPAGLRDLMEQTNLCDDPHLLVLVL